MIYSKEDFLNPRNTFKIGGYSFSLSERLDIVAVDEFRIMTTNHLGSGFVENIYQRTGIKAADFVRRYYDVIDLLFKPKK